METKKMPFFIKLKNAISNFDEYINFSEEKLSKAIKYFLKLIIIFTVIIAVLLTWKVVKGINKLTVDYKNESPEFSFQDNILIIEGENKRIVKGDERGYFGFIIDSEQDGLNNIEEINYYQRVISILKDKIIIRDRDGIETSITYEQLSQKYDINYINKNTVLQFLSRK